MSSAAAKPDVFSPPNRPPRYNHAFGHVVNMRVTEQPSEDEPKTLDTISNMRAFVLQDAQQPALVALNRALGNQLGSVFGFVKRTVRFVTDQETARALGLPDDTEVLIRPVDLLTMRDPQGDCDDFSMLTAALEIAGGRRAAFKTIAAADDPNTYTHVYVLVEDDDGRFVPMDTSHGSGPGWEARATGKTRIHPINYQETGGTMRPRQNLSAIDWGNLATKGVDAATNILTAKFGVPPVGTTIQTPQGVITRPYQGEPLTYPGLNVSPGTSSTVLTFGLIAVGLVVALSLAKR